MNSIEHLRDLFEYDDWATRRTIAALDDTPSERSLRILAHILITKQEYFERLSGKDSTAFDFWPDLTLDECKVLAMATAENYARVLERSADAAIEQIADYKTSEGIRHDNNVRDLLTHVLVHSSIHRGNIVLKMREEGLEPPKIDYIIYLREKE